MAASVKTYASMVAIFGAIMPEPLEIPAKAHGGAANLPNKARAFGERICRHKCSRTGLPIGRAQAFRETRYNAANEVRIVQRLADHARCAEKAGWSIC